MDEARVNAIIEAVIRELTGSSGSSGSAPAAAKAALPPAPAPAAPGELSIDLPDPTTAVRRYQPGVQNPRDPDALRALIASTTARIGVGRAGPRYRTGPLLLFQADHAVTQDALYRDVDQTLLDELGLFTVQTNVTGGKQEYLLRPDLGRQISEDGKRLIRERCVPAPQIQIVVGDGLSAAAVEANVREMLPVLRQGAQAAGLSLGTPFFIKYCRVGVLNEIGDLL
jgi:ethanolamine ammonia-lyase small subunit